MLRRVDLVHPLRCACGAVQGHIESPQVAGRAVCYCRDCQAFARFLERADTVLDARGGTEVVATRPRHVHFTQGVEQLRCMSLKPGGLLRWYTACCHTPIGNLPADPRVPYVSLVRTCLPGSKAELDAVFGPCEVAVNTQGASAPVRATPVATLFAVLKILRAAIPERLSGRYRQNPFRRADTGAPIVAPLVLSAEQRRALRGEG